MKGLLISFFTGVFVGFAYPGLPQAVFEQSTQTTVSRGEQAIVMPWSGGFNACQYNKADLDGDGIEEWILYERSGNVYKIFRIIENEPVPADELAVLLPEIPAGWVLFVDYNGDGKKDIFSNGDRGIIVFKNIGILGEPAKWQKAADPLLTTGFSGKINLIANLADIPAITDIDSDGDIDILVYNFSVGGYIRYNRNLSMELYGNADSLDYEIATRTWGSFEECDCNLFAFNGETCADLSSGRAEHAGGKALLAIDMNGDGDKDLLAGHEQCIELYYFENAGDADSAYMTGYSNMFPAGTIPSNFEIFPAAYFEDLDFDGVKDLAVTPSFEENYGYKIDFRRSNWFYKNTGTDEVPDFSFRQNNFLQDRTLDFGEHSVPVFADINADGKTDILIAANGYRNDEFFSGYITELENVGTAGNPSFKIVNENYLNAASLSLINPVINPVDVNGDAMLDLIYGGTDIENFKLVTRAFINQSAPGEPFSFDLTDYETIELPESASPNDNPTFYDINGDGLPDLLLGKSSGALEYYANIGEMRFELIDPSYLGIDRDFTTTRRNVTASVADLNRDGRPDLIVTDSGGKGRVYFSFQNQSDSNPQSEQMVYNNTISESEEPVAFDSKSWISAADIFGDGKECIAVGGIRGGLQLYQNISGGSGGGEVPVPELNVYPNPVGNNAILFIETNENMTMQLVSLLGQTLGEPFTVGKYEKYLMNVDHLRDGMYILSAVTDSGDKASKLFMIMQ